MSSEYILANASDELQRMMFLEHEFDWLTQRRLEFCKISQGCFCLEIGPGAGSIARWMADKAGESGKVIAIDKHPTHFSTQGRDNIEFIAADITSSEVHKAYQNYFDIVHARFVLVHIPDCEELIAKLVSMLKPGGWLALEEPDFSTTVSLEDIDNNTFKTITALQTFVMQKGSKTPFAKRLPYLFQELDLLNIQAEGYVPINRGQSYLSKLLYMTVNSLRNALVDSRLLTEEMIEEFLEDCRNPSKWIRECQVICISGQRT